MEEGAVIAAKGFSGIWRYLDRQVDASPVTVGGVGLIVATYLWSFWLRRPSKASSCQSCCAPATTVAAEKSIAPETMTNQDISIACALSQGQFAERKELVQRLAQEATERRNLPNGVGLRFKPVSDRVSELAKLVDLGEHKKPGA